MTRSLLSVAAALLAATTFFAPAAEACISCNYVPEVAHTPVRGAKTAQRKRVIVAAQPRVARSAETRVAAATPAERKPETQTGSVAESAATSPLANVPTEARLLSGAPTADAPAADAAAAPSETTKVADLGCKKFIATAGVTVSVPCE